MSGRPTTYVTCRLEYVNNAALDADGNLPVVAHVLSVHHETLDADRAMRAVIDAGGVATVLLVLPRPTDPLPEPGDVFETGEQGKGANRRRFAHSAIPCPFPPEIPCDVDPAAWSADGHATCNESGA